MIGALYNLNIRFTDPFIQNYGVQPFNKPSRLWVEFPFGGTRTRQSAPLSSATQHAMSRIRAERA